MSLFLDDGDVRLYHGDALEQLALMPSESVHCIVTSPPFWGLRSYIADDHADKSLEHGLEPTPEEWCARLVVVMHEARRVLRSDGVCFIEIGDSYAEKQLVGAPWRLAFALQFDGWFLRSEIIWSKPNPMPESVTDRPTKGHSTIFLLTKSPRYFMDMDAIRETQSELTVEKYGHRENGAQIRTGDADEARGEAMARANTYMPQNVQPDGRRNARSVWSIPEEEDIEWTGQIGFCRKCNGLTVAGYGSADTTATATDASGVQANAELTAASTSDSSAPSLTDTPSTTSARTPDASTPPTSSQSPSASTSSAATRQPDATRTSGTATTATSSRLRTLIAAYRAQGNAVCACNGAPARTGDVWQIATEPTPFAHFATFPQALVERCIKAGTSEHGSCSECGAPWRRITERTYLSETVTPDAPDESLRHSTGRARNVTRMGNGVDVSTTGWEPSCAHTKTAAYARQLHADSLVGGLPPSPRRPVEPCVVLDPFMGSGTTALVARRLGRRAIGIDLSLDYLAIAAKRLEQLSLLA